MLGATHIAADWVAVLVRLLMLPLLLRRQRGHGFAQRLVPGHIQLLPLLVSQKRQRLVNGDELCFKRLRVLCRCLVRQSVNKRLCSLHCRVVLFFVLQGGVFVDGVAITNIRTALHLLSSRTCIFRQRCRRQHCQTQSQNKK